MATTDAKTGFRLPWAADRGDAATAAVEEAVLTTDALVEPLMHQEDDTPAMIDAPANPASPAANPASPAAATAPRKPNKLMADLTKAMQAAAENARADALARLSTDAKTHIEGIHGDSATEATDLRRRADDDVAAIREWSKAEIARIRETTEQRIGDRKSALERQIDDQAAAIEQRIERVQRRVAAFEAEMAAFFERIGAEDDPTRLVSMAESLPEPPAFYSDADTADSPTASAHSAPVVDVAVEAVAIADAPADAPAEAPVAVAVDVEASIVQDPAADLFSIGADDGPDATETDPRLAALELGDDFAAAEAEAAALGGLEPRSDDDIPTIADDALAARLARLVPDSDATAGTVRTSTVVVTGLVSVASIAGFKRQLSRILGVVSVGVSSGPDGEFVFAVGHDSSLSLNDAIATLPGFSARVTGGTDGDLQVTARDPETEG